MGDEKDKAQYVAEKARQTLGELYEWKVLAKGIAVIYDMLIEGDFETRKPLLKQYIRDSYQPKFWDKRQEQKTPVPEDILERRKGERRQQQLRIDFIERRRVIDAE